MRQKILIWMVILITLTIGVNAGNWADTTMQQDLYDNMTLGYYFDNSTSDGDSATTAVDIKGVYNCTFAQQDANSGWTTSAKINNATTYDEAEDYCINSDSALDNIFATNQLTVCAWVNTQGSTYSDVVGKKFQLFFRAEDNVNFKFYVRNNANTTWFLADSGVNLAHNVWHHLCGVYNGTHVSTYINGTLAGTPTANTQTLPVITNDFYIGNADDLNTDFDGEIDELYIWASRGLTPLEIETLYDETEAGNQLIAVIPPPSSNETINISLISPLNNSNHTIGTITHIFNLSVPQSLIVENCSLIINGTINETIQRYTFQNPANTTNITGLWVDSSLIDDGNYSSFSYGGEPPFEGYLYKNYSKPSGVTSALLDYRVGVTARTNLTVPSACFNRSILQFRVVSESLSPSTIISCRNDTGWGTMVNLASEYFYELSAWWINSLNSTYNITISGMSNGYYNWTIGCYDNQSNITTTDEFFYALEIPAPPHPSPESWHTRGASGINIYVFMTLSGLSLILVIVGLAKPEESSQALIGYTFLFFLSFVLIGNSLIYKTGEIKTVENFYDGSDLDNQSEIITDYYSAFNETDGDRGLITTHNFGYWLAIASFLGFIMVIFGLTGGFRRGE